MTQVDIRAKGSVLLESSKFSSDSNLNVWADQDITFKGVSIVGASSDVSGKLSATSKSKSIYVNTNKAEMELLKNGNPLPDANTLAAAPVKAATRTVMRATAVHFTADDGDIFVNGVSFDRGNVASGSEFQARAKGTIGIYDSTINHAKALIAANTVVLKDVTFGGNDVTLRSQTGFVAARPGTGQAVAPGHVNFVSGVYYNSTEVRLPGMTNPQGQAGFLNAAANNHADYGGAKNFSGLKIQTLGGVTH